MRICLTLLPKIIHRLPRGVINYDMETRSTQIPGTIIQLRWVCGLLMLLLFSWLLNNYFINKSTSRNYYEQFPVSNWYLNIYFTHYMYFVYKLSHLKFTWLWKGLLYKFVSWPYTVDTGPVIGSRERFTKILTTYYIKGA